MTSSPPAEQRGAQRPRILAAPPAASNEAGQEAVELADAAGLDLDQWQRYFLAQSLAERADGTWAAFECGLVVPRQNGKGGILEARQLAGLFLFGDRLQLHSAHQFDTALEAFHRIMALIEDTPDLDALVKRVSRAHGEEGVELKNGNRLRFKARTSRGGRGFSGDAVYLDEAMYLPPAAKAALLPTLSARPNPQLWYTGSAVDAAEHPDGLELAGVRRRALAGDDPSLCYAEWSAPTDKHPDDLTDDELADPEWERQANPALGIRISREHVANERRSMSRRAYAVERLGIGVWPVPEEAEHVIPPDVWGQLVDRTSVPSDPIALAVDMPPDRSRTVIGMAGWRADGRVHGEIIDDRPGTTWVLPRLVELVRRWDPCVIVIDQRSAAMSLLQGLAEHDLEAETTGARDMAAAAGGFYDDATQDRFRHLGQPELDEAVAAARKRNLGDAWAWDRRGTVPITPLVVVSLARWGLIVHGRVTAPPAPRALDSIGARDEFLPSWVAGGDLGLITAGLTDDLTSAGF